ncbi:MAG TPA: AMP-binding protein, partial [Acidimicrobiales bacterium]|nr:AMP-binding protein [Acidimicrobiales bacterium]
MTDKTDGVAGDPRLDALRKGMIASFWADARPDQPAIISPHGHRTFAQLNAKANQLVRALRRRGLDPGDSIVLLCANRPEFAEVAAASQRSGLRLTPVNWHLTAEEASYIVADCGAKVLIADARFAETAVKAAHAPCVTVRLAVGGIIDGFEPYARMTSAEDAADIDDPILGSAMLYTSGTTGRPKGVHRPRNVSETAVTAPIVASAQAAREGPSMHLCTGPLYHTAPLAFSLAMPLAQGMSVVLMDGWEAGDTLRLIDQHRVTHTHMVPTMFHRLLSLPEDERESYNTSSLRY